MRATETRTATQSTETRTATQSAETRTTTQSAETRTATIMLPATGKTIPKEEIIIPGPIITEAAEMNTIENQNNGITPKV